MALVSTTTGHSLQTTRICLNLALPGRANRGNAAHAIAAAVQGFGVDLDKAIAAAEGIDGWKGSVSSARTTLGDAKSLASSISSSLDTAGALMTSAQAVGDDNIQRRSGGQVQPDSWTHGSSEQREKAFLAGYNSGKMSQCDTLERGAYRG